MKTRRTVPSNIFRQASAVRLSIRHHCLGLALLSLLITCEAWAQAPLLTISDPSGEFSALDFGKQVVGTSATQVVTLGNSGTAALTISGIGITGSNIGDFRITNTSTCPGPLQPGTSCTVNITFTPHAVGDSSAELTITDSSGAVYVYPLMGKGVAPASLRAVGTIDFRDDFPLWYQDARGVRLDLCLIGPNCAFALPNQAAPPSVTDTGSNFPGEAFYFRAISIIPRSTFGNALLVLTVQATFNRGFPGVNDQIAFARIRVKIPGLTPGAFYTVTHPYGVDTIQADPVGAKVPGQLLQTIDTPCFGLKPCNFQNALDGRVPAAFLKWDPAVAPAATPGFLGDAVTDHPVVHSPFGTNFFQVDGPDVGGPGINTIQTNLFRITGQIDPNSPAQP